MQAKAAVSKKIRHLSDDYTCVNEIGQRTLTSTAKFQEIARVSSERLLSGLRHDFPLVTLNSLEQEKMEGRVEPRSKNQSQNNFMQEDSTYRWDCDPSGNKA